MSSWLFWHRSSNNGRETTGGAGTRNTNNNSIGGPSSSSCAIGLPAVPKTCYYVWYLGTREASDGVRGASVVFPAMRQLIRDAFERTPSKATVQVSCKGLKLVQAMPTVTKRGKTKMQMLKLHVAANALTYRLTNWSKRCRKGAAEISLIGRAPFDDVVGVVMLAANAELAGPVHVHCYRCDSPETATLLHSNLQLLISRPDAQRAIAELERRLVAAGFLTAASSTPSQPSRQQRHHQRHHEPESLPAPAGGVISVDRIGGGRPVRRRIAINELRNQLLAERGAQTVLGGGSMVARSVIARHPAFGPLTQSISRHASATEVHRTGPEGVSRFWWNNDHGGAAAMATEKARRLGGAGDFEGTSRSQSVEQLYSEAVVSTDLLGGGGAAGTLHDARSRRRNIGFGSRDVRLLDY